MAMHQLHSVAARKAATITQDQGQTVALVFDTSAEGWRAVHADLAALGFGDDTYMTQLAWWPDAELWLIEAV